MPRRYSFHDRELVVGKLTGIYDNEICVLDPNKQTVGSSKVLLFLVNIEKLIPVNPDEVKSHFVNACNYNETDFAKKVYIERQKKGNIPITVFDPKEIAKLDITKQENRSPHCYRCKKHLNEMDFPICVKCKWIICSCGACKCGYEEFLRNLLVR